MKLRYKLAIGAALVAGTLAPTAAGSPSADLAAVGRDYASGRDITPCRFTVAQLQGARSLINPDVETYAAGLGAAIDGEIKRWKDGGCTAKKVAAAAGPKLRIVSVQPKGGARAESVTIRNLSGKTVDLRGFALRDAGDHTLKFRSTKLKRGCEPARRHGLPQGLEEGRAARHALLLLPLQAGLGRRRRHRRAARPRWRAAVDQDVRHAACPTP